MIRPSQIMDRETGERELDTALTQLRSLDASNTNARGAIEWRIGRIRQRLRDLK